MYDLRYLRDNLDGLRAQLGPRGADIPWDDLRKFIEERRTLTMKLEQERHEIRKVSEEVGRLMRENKAEEAMKLPEAHGISTRRLEIARQEEELRAIEQKVIDLNLRIPNLPHASVPIGKDAGDNKETRKWGSPPHCAHRPRAIGRSAKPSAFWISTARQKSQARDLPL